MSIPIGFALIALGMLAQPSLEPPYVLAVGVNQPNSLGALAPLLHADDDAVALVELFGADPTKTWLLSMLDAETEEWFPNAAKQARVPTRKELEQTITEISRRLTADRAIGKQSSVIILLVGHAARDARGVVEYLLQDERLSIDAIEKIIVEPLTHAHRIHLIVDTCYAEALVRPRAEIKTIPAGEVHAEFMRHAKTRFANVGLLLGSTAHRRAYEWDEIGSGVFSALLRSALMGIADANEDGKTNYDEIAAYVTAAAEGVPLPSARPQIVMRAPAIERNVALSEAAWFQNSVRMPNNVEGRFHIFDQKGRWLVGGHLESGYRPQLWYSAERSPHSLRTETAVFALKNIGDQLEQMFELHEGATARNGIDLAFRQGLFAVAFGPAYFRGFSAAPKLDWPPPTLNAQAPSTSPWVTAAWVGAAVAGATAIASSVVAAEAAIASNNTSLERSAFLAEQRRNQALTAVGISLGAAVALSTTAILTEAFAQ